MKNRWKDSFRICPCTEIEGQPCLWRWMPMWKMGSLGLSWEGGAGERHGIPSVLWGSHKGSLWQVPYELKVAEKQPLTPEVTWRPLTHAVCWIHTNTNIVLDKAYERSALKCKVKFITVQRVVVITKLTARCLSFITGEIERLLNYIELMCAVISCLITSDRN